MTDKPSICSHCGSLLSDDDPGEDCYRCHKPVCEECGVGKTIHSWDNPPEVLVYHQECAPGYQDPDRWREEQQERKRRIVDMEDI